MKHIFKKIIATSIAISLLLLPASALAPKAENALTYTEFLYVTNSEVLPLSTDSIKDYTTGSSGITVALPVSIESNGNTTTMTVDLTDTQKLVNRDQKLEVADYILALAGFSDEEIDWLSSDSKIELTTGLEFAAMRASAKETDSDSAEYSNWSSTLTYTRKSVDRYYFTNLGKGIGKSFKWGQSIAVQGFAMEEDTFKLEYDYELIDINGNHVKDVSDSYDENDPGFESITSSSSGTGVSYVFNIDTGHYLTKEGGTYMMSCYGTVSNVNEPGSGSGSTGGAFNVYGNLVLITGPMPSISVTYPWGISVSGVGSEGISCKTSLTAVLYR